MLTLLEIAADLRATGVGWARIGERVHHSPDYCRDWPRLYPDHWRRLYREAERRVLFQLRNQAASVLQNLMEDADKKIRLAAVNTVMKIKEPPEPPAATSASSPDRAAPPEGTNDTEIWNNVCLVKTLDDPTLKRTADGPEPGQPQSAATAGGAGGAAAAPGSAQPG
jgi:hypothetical protein